MPCHDLNAILHICIYHLKWVTCTLIFHEIVEHWQPAYKTAFAMLSNYGANTCW